jgi:hypothetical protein
MKLFFILAAIVFLTFQDSYAPLIPGSSWVYKTTDGSFEDYISEEKFTYNKIDYFQNIRKYSDGTAAISYYRIEKNGALHYLDNKSFKESIEIPSHPRLSFRWSSSDNKWHYKIVEVDSELKTPLHIFKNCIAIKAESNDGSVYINYYSKGIGFVGSKADGKLVAYLSKWQIKEKQS